MAIIFVRNMKTILPSIGIIIFRKYLHGIENCRSEYENVVGICRDCFSFFSIAGRKANKSHSFSNFGLLTDQKRMFFRLSVFIVESVVIQQEQGIKATPIDSNSCMQEIGSSRCHYTLH